MTRADLVRHYASLLETTPDMMLLLNEEGRLQHANPAARALFPAEDDGPSNLAMRLLQETCPHGFTTTTHPLQQARLRVPLPDGAGTRHVLWRCLILPATDGSLMLAAGTVRGSERGEAMGFTVLASGVIQAASPRLCALCGYSSTELIGRPARQFYFTASSRRRIVSQLQEHSEIENGEVTLRRKDGSPLTLWYTAESIRNEQGNVQAYSGYFQERTFPYTARLAHDFSRIVDALPGMAWVCGRDLRIVAVNAAYLEAYGTSADKVLGRTEHDFMPHEQARFPMEAALKVFEDKQELLHPAVPHLTDPGVWHRVIRRPIFDDEHTEVIGLLGIAQDITPKVLQENIFMQQLCQSEEDVVVVTDDQGRILRRSARTLQPSIYGRPDLYDAYTLDMRPVLDTIHGEDLPAVRQAMHTALREHTVQHVECRVRNQTGQFSRVLSRLVYNDQIYGEPRMYVVVRDISSTSLLRSAGLVIERLKEASGTGTDRELARFLNVSPAAVSNARKNDRVPPDWIIDTGLRTGRSIDWLVRGGQANGAE